MSTPHVQKTHRYLRIAVLIAVGFLLGACFMYLIAPFTDVRFTVNTPYQDFQEQNEAYALSREFPTRLRIPKISVDTAFDAPLGLKENKEIEVPTSYEKVGWYKLGASPGELGTASILGHVDSTEGPAVFYELGRLSKGDRIFIMREDGHEAEFEVEHLDRYAQEEFPTRTVYAPTPYPSLRLITCSGTYLPDEQRYSHNLVVFARLVASEESF